MKKRATVYFDPDIHKALRMRAASTERSKSHFVNDAVRQALSEDQEDLASHGCMKLLEAWWLFLAQTHEFGPITLRYSVRRISS